MLNLWNSFPRNPNVGKYTSTMVHLGWMYHEKSWSFMMIWWDLDGMHMEFHGIVDGDFYSGMQNWILWWCHGGLIWFELGVHRVVIPRWYDIGVFLKRDDLSSSYGRCHGNRMTNHGMSGVPFFQSKMGVESQGVEPGTLRFQAN